ncbi:hypothetical protein OAN22_00230 [Alphaproteobacteria bacterium]|nr:hypothetical protein [Alphaproteobacteria bacterium]
MKYLLLLSVLFSVQSFANDKDYFDRLDMLKNRISEGAQENSQLEYISIFPRNFKKFTETFGYLPERNIKNLYYSSYDHISALIKISKTRPDKVMNLMLSIAIDSNWDADAVNYLQKSLAELIHSHIDLFLSSFSKIKKDDQKKIIRFVSDVENHSCYEDYNKILKKLRTRKKILYNDFLAAKNKRMKHKNRG